MNQQTEYNVEYWVTRPMRVTIEAPEGLTAAEVIDLVSKDDFADRVDISTNDDDFCAWHDKSVRSVETQDGNVIN